MPHLLPCPASGLSNSIGDGESSRPHPCAATVRVVRGPGANFLEFLQKHAAGQPRPVNPNTEHAFANLDRRNPTRNTLRGNPNRPPPTRTQGCICTLAQHFFFKHGCSVPCYGGPCWGDIPRGISPGGYPPGEIPQGISPGYPPGDIPRGNFW